ncbi:unnamed protein product [Cunninghamella blakesleeana]
MNSLRITTRALPLKTFTRGFHVNRPCFTGKTIEATSETFKQLVMKLITLLLLIFMLSIWCGPCKMLTPILSKAVANNPSVTLVKINVDDHSDVASTYQIASLPTVIAFNNGKPIDKFIGLLNKAKVDEFVKAHADRK